MTQTRRHRQIQREDDGYVPPPSVFEGRGFAAFSSTAAPSPASEAPAPVQTGLTVQELIECIEPAPERDFGYGGSEASLDDDEPLWVPKAPPAEQPSFNDLILGSGGDYDRLREEDSVTGKDTDGHDRLATASLAVALSGIVTVVGFPAGSLMGHAALRRMGSASWYHGTVKAERRARNAVMIGYVGMAVLAAAALLIAAWWLLQTPVGTLLPGPETTDSSTLTTTGGTR